MTVGSVDQGGRIDIRADVLCFDPAHENHLCSAVPCGTKFGFRGLLSGDSHSFSALNAIMCKQFPTPLLVSDDQSRIFGISKPSWETLHSVIDACSGFGGLTQGAIAMGFHPVVAVDQNERMISLYKAHLNVDTIVGNIGENDTIRNIAACAHGAASMTAGFNCQPFSALGDGRGGNDPRAASLTGVLRAAFYLGIQILFLECVEPAGDNAFVTGEIERFLKSTGFICSRVNLALQKVWPSRRNRAWWLISSPMIGQVPLFDWGSCKDVTTVGHVIPRITCWDQSDELALQLNAEELDAFGVNDGSVTRFLLNLAGHSPCALHAWGSQLHPCPCGCRSCALSAHRLQSKGLYGLLVKCLSPDGSVTFRHAHPNEVMALQCMDPVLDFGPQVKLTLSAAGQIASPAQALWLFAHVWSPEVEPVQDTNMVSLMQFWSQVHDLSLNELVYGPRWPEIEGPLHLASILDFLIRRTVNAIPAMPTEMSDSVMEVAHDDSAPTPWLDQPKVDVSQWLPNLSPTMGHVLFAELGEPPISFEVDSNVTIQQVLAAQAKLSGPFETLEIFDPKGCRLSEHDVIQPGSVVCVRVRSDVHDVVVQSDQVSSWECGRLPTMPVGPFEADSGECGLLPKMPEGECGLLPKMPVGPSATDQGECGLLPKMPVQAFGAIDTGVQFGNDGPLEAITDAVPLGDVSSGSRDVVKAHAPAPTQMDVDSQMLAPKKGFGPCPVISPTLEWSQPPSEQKSNRGVSIHDVGECVITPGAHAGSHCCLSAVPLLGLQGTQFLKLSVPTVENPQHLWSLRHQFYTVEDRLAILERQLTVWADDEIRFHLHALTAQFVELQVQHSKTTIRQCQVVDPLVSSAWVRNARFLAHWAADHPEIFAQQVQLVTAVLIEDNWIPVILQPNGDVLNCLMWDASTETHEALCSSLDKLAHALGFSRSFVNCHKRLFFTSSLCGALAISFVQHILIGTLLPTSDVDAHLFHARYRDLFCQALSAAEITTRPWQWGKGDPSSSMTDEPFRQPQTNVSTGFGQDGGFSHVCISLDERINLMQAHGMEWSDDEVRYHIVNMLNSRDNVARHRYASIPGFAFLEPLIMESFRDVGQQLCAAWCREHLHIRDHGHHIVTALLHDFHWTPVWIVPHGTTLVMHLYGSDRRCESKAEQLLHCLVEELGFADWAIHWSNPSLPDHNMCGAQTIAFLGHIIVQARLPVSLTQLRDLHTEMRANFVAALYNGYTCRCPIAWGLGPTHQVLRDLAEELSKHGVPKDQVESRAQQALKALGSEQIITALQHRQPWRQLKILGNNARFQFLLPSEFNAMIEANQGKSVGKKPKHAKPVLSTNPTPLDPSKLVLLDGTFRANGLPVAQIVPQQIGPVASGVALISLSAALPFLRAGNQVSQEPLALLIVHKDEIDVTTSMPHTRITVPCKCALNQEPLLIEATLVQLGGTPVEKHVQTAAVAVDSLEVAAIKFLVYADEFPGDWSEFCSAPIKHLVQEFPVLKRCFDANCGCGCWHNLDKLPVKEPILDVWRRQHLKTNFKQVAMDKSELFSVCLRVPLEIVAPILSASGKSGAYAEPRTPDAKSLLDQYAVIWTPKFSVEELQHAKQTHPAVVGLTRLGDRRGLRVLSSQAQEMHQILKPDTVFLPQGPRLQFVAGPFPWGTDRHAIQRAMKLIKWDTKPLQPLQPVPGRGTMWMLQSVDEPPESIVTMSHGEVLITKHRDVSHGPKATSSHPVGSVSTLSLCTSASGPKTSEDDPFAKHDPWSNFQPSTKPAAPVASSHSDSMQQLEMRIQHAVLAKVQSGTQMEQDDLPERLQALEGQVQQLVAKQQNIDVQFKDFAGQHSQQMATMQTQLNHQTAQVHGHLENHTQAMQAMFESQMQQIRGLLSKRPREEGGEASNPGPPEPDHGVFTIGAFNPSGLRNKAQFIHSEVPEGDIWAISETHFFGRDLQRFRAGLRFAKSRYRYCIVDQPSLKPTVLQKKSWKGVAVLSPHPTRHVSNGLPFELINSGRIMFSTTLVRDVWVTGVTLYGEPDGHLYPSRVEHNAALLHHAACQICHLQTGLRFVAGDLNMSFDEVPAFDILRGAGFKDVQDLAAERWGVAIQPTCKSRTRKDYLFLSPELQSLLREVWVVQDIWPDHAVLQASFQDPSALPRRLIWPSPPEFPWPTQFATSFVWQVDHPDPSTQYADLWTAVEQSAAAACPVPVHKSMTGRAQHQSPVSLSRQGQPPVKVGRPGDFQPEFHGVSFRHSQWIRQVRRFQCYVRAVRHEHNQNTALLSTLWGAIVRARGFVPSFPQWWSNIPVRHPGCPESCPQLPPSLVVAEAMFDSLSQTVRQLESQMKQSSRQYAKLRRETDPNLVFRDLRAQPNQGVELLAQSRHALVESVDAHDCTVVLTSPQTWNLDFPIYCNVQQLDVIHVEGDCLWLHDVDGLSAGMRVSQTKWLGKDDEIAQEFLEAWRSKWMRHANVPEDRWSVILDFARNHLPRQMFSWDPLDAASLAGVIASKHKRSAPGLDGVTLRDLQLMPAPILHQFCRIFCTAEKHGKWPSQIIDGRVTSLAKRDEPSTAMDFRPITVFSLLYRCWGSFHSRKAIQKLDDHLPSSLYGSRANCHANQVWSKVMYAIEFAFQHQMRLCGLVADIQKAFNCLPRLVVFEACGQLGIPTYVLHAWAAAVSTMRCRFVLRQNISDPVLSCTGFAEGDGLSCVAMLAVDTLFHHWYLVFFPLCQPLTYVDDWQVLCTNPDRLDDIKQCLDRFVDAVDLDLDEHKTYVWSLDSASRQQFRGAGFTVVLGARNLGAQVQMSRKHLNSVQIARVDSLQPLWGRLRMSLCSYAAKLRAIRAAAWPKGLHAIASTTLSDQTFQNLRAGAMKGLSADGAGCSAILHLGLVEDPHSDPLFWSCIQTFRSARDCGDKHVVTDALLALVAGDPSIPSNGINAVLLSRLQVFDWHVQADGQLCDSFGSFGLFRVSIAELVWRAAWSWKQWVQSCVAHRPGLVALSRVDPHATRQWLHRLSVSDKALAKKLLNGAHITQDCKVHCQEDGTSQCPFCDCSDSRFHRFWQCEYFARLRSEVDPGVFKLAPCLPEAVSSYGWSLQASTSQEWWQRLASISNPVVLPCLEVPVLHLFTDGSCMFQHDPELRLASWAVVFGSATGDLAQAQVLASGPLPGILQTAHRGEAFAVLQALRLARPRCASIMLWTDCESVVKRVRKLLRGVPPKINSGNADIWMQVFDQLQVWPAGTVQITHVHSHLPVLHASSVFEEWCFFHNALADRAASSANAARSVEFWHFFDTHVHALRHARFISLQVQSNLLRISKAVVQTEETAETSAELTGFCEPSPVPEDAWKGLQGAFFVPEGAVRWYGDSLVRKLLSWFWFTVSEASPVLWVSQFQLYIDFMLSSGEVGPTHFAGWEDGSSVPLSSLVNVSFKVRCRWFSKVLKESLRHQRQVVVHSFCRPHSAALHLHTGCLAVPWPQTRLDRVDSWLLSHLPGGVRRTAKALDSLPTAEHERSMTFFTSSG
eukprot:s1093_g2.t1